MTQDYSAFEEILKTLVDKPSNNAEKRVDYRGMIIDCITLLKKHSDKVDKINDALFPCNLIGLDEHLLTIIDMLMSYLLTHEGYDLVCWWLYENVDKKLFDGKTGEVTDDLTEVEALVDYILKTYPVKVS